MTAASACGNPFAITPTTPTITDTLAVYGLTDAPPNGPTAVNTFGPTLVTTSATSHYDIVFDIRQDSAGNPQAYALPPKAVASFGTAGFVVDSTQAFDAIQFAPNVPYNDSTIVPLKAGTIVVVQALSAACSVQLVAAQQFIYSKIVIDSINYTPFNGFTNPAGNTIYFRIKVDPNCGFRSFKDGLPTF
ncbi:MAG TPA: hypothetical protein VIC24_06950 [Gemmatimonadaceae bacterium]